MAQDTYGQWEQQSAQAMDIDLYRAGQRAGASAATHTWPTIERMPQQGASKGMQAAIDLFGKKGVARNRWYRVGWMEGYTACCADKRREVLVLICSVDHLLRPSAGGEIVATLDASTVLG